MVDISKINRITPTPNLPRQDKDSSGGVDKGWKTELKSSTLPPEASSVRTMQMKLERAPQNLTNQNGMLTPQQMAQHLSKELARRTAQAKSVRSKRSIDRDLGVILDENKELSSLLDSGSEGDIAAFLAFFQAEMEKHLSGMEFGEIVYDQELMDKFFKKF